MFYEAARSANWFARSPRSANTPADRSKRATQRSPGAALPALCLLVPGRLGDPVHGLGGLVYGTGEKYDPVHGSGYLVYGIGKKRIAVHGIGDLVYGIVEKCNAVHGIGVLVCGTRIGICQRCV